jgi:hypothetical protein
MTRVDDLELENGRRGHNLRTGMASTMLTAQAAVPPRKILPVANKWKSKSFYFCGLFMTFRRHSCH